MKRLVVALMLLLSFSARVDAADAVNEVCNLCVGIRLNPEAPAPLVSVPALMEIDVSTLKADDSFLKRFTADQRSNTTIIFRAEAAGDQLTGVDSLISRLIEWSAANGPFEAVGLRVNGSTAETEAYALKRLTVNLQGRELARSIVQPVASIAALERLYAAEAGGYFDQVLVAQSDAVSVSSWLSTNDPVKRVWVVAPAVSANPLYDAASVFKTAAVRVFLESEAVTEFAGAIAATNSELRGDFAFDPSADIRMLDATGAVTATPVIALVRGEDLRTLVVPAGSRESSTILSFGDPALKNPRRVDASGVAAITDTGSKNARLLVGMPASGKAFAITLDRPRVADDSRTRETIDISTKKDISVDEIVRSHQTYHSWQGTLNTRYIARNETKLRFAVGPSEAVEATLAGDHFFEGDRVSDWVWTDFLINGVKWKHGRIPELPLVQPEKVTQLPLDIHLTSAYRYQLVRETQLRGFDTWEVRFEPPAKAPDSLPLYRGTVWIDQKSFARIRISMVQLNLDGEVLSNEERVDYSPFSLDGYAPVEAPAVTRKNSRKLLWLPESVAAQQSLSTAGRSTVVQRNTAFSNYRIDPSDFREQHRIASASTSRMVRDTTRGLRYLDRTGSGERVVKEGFDASRTFLVGGMHHDSGLEFPVVPLGGIDYFNFNVRGTGMQSNVFFAGVILAASLTDPSFMKTRFSLGGEFNGLAVPFENSMYRGGSEVEGEAVRNLPLTMTLRTGHPILTFGKIDLSLGISHESYQRAELTATDFEVPSNTFEVTPRLDLRYDRRGFAFSTFFARGTRTQWEPWGNLAEYDDAQKSFTRFGFSLGKSFYLPKFQRIAIEANYLDGANLDRFSKYEMGFFGTQRIRGIKSGSVRAEKAILAHLSYGFVFSQQFRLEVFYDHGLLDDAASGLRRAPFQGIGFGGQTVGPWGTLLRLDFGKSIGDNAQDGFVANVVFLKLFG